MKKAILTSSLALALGTTSVATAGQAYASETENTQKETVDFAQLAELAKAESASLNEKPVHAGPYHYEFSKDGFSYEFKSDGIYWTWEYKYTGAADTVVNKSVEVASVEAPKAEVQSVVSAPVAKTATQTAVKPAVQQTAYKAPVAKPAAVKTYKAPVQQTAAVSNTGGVNWSALAQCESGGNPSIVDASGTYHGLYQFDVQTWRAVGGSGLPSQASAAEQTKRAQILYSQRGSQPWPVCGARL